MTEVDYSMLNNLTGNDRWLHCLGNIIITNGTVAVGDPYIAVTNLSEKIKPGTYPVFSEAIPLNEAVFIRLSEKPAVRWENIALTNGVKGNWYGQEFQGYKSTAVTGVLSALKIRSF